MPMGGMTWVWVDTRHDVTQHIIIRTTEFSEDDSVVFSFF